MKEKNTNRSENQKSFRINGSEYIAEKRNAGIIVVGEIFAAKRQPKRTEKTDILFEKIPVTEKKCFWFLVAGYRIWDKNRTRVYTCHAEKNLATYSRHCDYGCNPLPALFLDHPSESSAEYH